MANDIVESSVQQIPDHSESVRHLVLRVANAYDPTLPKWWSPQRDAFLRKFWRTEPILASAVYSIAARNSAFGWDLSGLSEDVLWAQRLLQSADFGGGWQQLVTKTTIDLLSQDNGAAWEIVRPSKVTVDGLTLPAVKQYYENNEDAEWFALHPNGKIRLRGRSYKLFDSPLDPPIGIAHLDIGKVQRTGDPETPAIYTDIGGKRHAMKWWQIILFSDMPSPIEEMNGVGVCACSRVFRHAHTLQSLSVYKDEKLSGEFTRAVHITNADPGIIQDQITQSRQNAANVGLQRYSQPVIASTFDPSATPTVTTINLASMPDGFEESTTLEWYVSVLALALGVDYGFLAPLPGKGLGTASQSETMARQSRGKSSRLFMDTTSNALNFRGILPQSVRFKYIERDTQQEQQEETVKKLRAETRTIMIKSGEISPQIARQIASDEGDLEEKYLNAMGEQNLTPGVEIGGDDNLHARDTVSNAAGDSSLLLATEPLGDVEPLDITETETETATASLRKDYSFDQKAIKARYNFLFPTSTLAQKVTNAARKAIRKEQEEEDPLSDALDTYHDELLDLAQSANESLITQSVFEDALLTLSGLTLLAIFELGYNDPSYNDRETKLSPIITSLINTNADAIPGFADAIYSGRYTDRKDVLERRVALWRDSASAAYPIGQISAPSRKDQRYEFVMGPTSDHCVDCTRLDGQVHTSSEWQANSKYLPRSRDLACSGFRCLCTLEETDDAISGNF